MMIKLEGLSTSALKISMEGEVVLLEVWQEA